MELNGKVLIERVLFFGSLSAHKFFDGYSMDAKSVQIIEHEDLI
jgi:hypothetical protein